MDRPVQVDLAPDQRRHARRRAAERGLTLSGYIARLIVADLKAWNAEPAAAATIPIDVELPTDHHAGTFIGEAVAARMARPSKDAS